MSAGDVINCLAGDLFADPYTVLEAIREDSDLREVFRDTCRDFSNYEQLLNKMNEVL